MGLFGKKYKNSEELLGDVLLKKNLMDATKFVTNSLRKGEPYPGDFTHEKLIVFEFYLSVSLKNDESNAIDNAVMLSDKIMPYVLMSLDKNRKDEYLSILPIAQIENVFFNLPSGDIYVTKLKAAVAFVLSYLWIKNETMELVYNLPEGEKGRYFYEIASTYENKDAVLWLNKAIEKENIKIEKKKMKKQKK